MKRWKIILGRGGTTLIAISLALLLVSIIPQPQVSRSGGSGSFAPGSVNVMFNRQDLTPQMQLNVAVTVDEGSLKVYLLNIDLEFSPSMGSYRFNATDLEKIVDEDPERILWEREVGNGRFERSYSPTRIVNASLVMFNPNSETARFDYQVTLTSSLAPGEKVRNIAYVAAPLGIVLMIPWFLNWWKQRKNK